MKVLKFSDPENKISETDQYVKLSEHEIIASISGYLYFQININDTFNAIGDINRWVAQGNRYLDENFFFQLCQSRPVFIFRENTKLFSLVNDFLGYMEIYEEEKRSVA